MPAHRHSVLVFQHLASEGPGSIGVGLRAAGFDLVTAELDQRDKIPDLSAFDLMLVMGGPMDVWHEDRHPWLVDEKAGIRRWVTELRRPFLGVCLGHQLLADALGGTVGPMADPEIGVYRVDAAPAASSDVLFSALPAHIEALQWHGAEVHQIPSGATILAANAVCSVQAFRVGRHAWGVQFHVEAEPGTISEWAQVPAYRRALEGAYPGGIGRFEAAVNERRQHLQGVSAVLTEKLAAIVTTAANGATRGPPTAPGLSEPEAASGW